MYIWLLKYNFKILNSVPTDYNLKEKASQKVSLAGGEKLLSRQDILLGHAQNLSRLSKRGILRKPIISNILSKKLLTNI